MSGNDSYEGIWVNYPDKPEQSPASVVREALSDEDSGGGDPDLSFMLPKETRDSIRDKTERLNSLNDNTPPQRREALEDFEKVVHFAMSQAKKAGHTRPHDAMQRPISNVRRALTEPAPPTVNVIAQRQWQWVERMGWHNKTPLEYTALIGSEVGEATNECRGDEPSDRLGEELADIVLRVGDMAVHFGIDLEGEIDRKMAVNEQRGTRGRAK